MSAHTPGPWHVGGIFMPNTPDAFCSIWGAIPAGYQSGDQVAQQVHPKDASLIAAAPDLLAALIAMRNRWEPDATGTDRRMWEAANAAIAKATK